MATKARVGAGALLQYGDGASPEVFTTVSEVLTLQKGSTKIDFPDSTNMDSPVLNGVVFREFITGLGDGGVVDVTMNFLFGITAQENFRNLADGAKHNFKIVPPLLPGQNVKGSFSFTGYVAIPSDIEFPIDKAMTVKAQIKITGVTTVVLPS